MKDLIIFAYVTIFLLMNIYQINLVYITLRYFLLKLLNGERKFDKILDTENLPLITIQIPTFNERPKFIIEQVLESIRRQNYPKELLQILIASQSPDRKLVARLKAKIASFKKKTNLNIKFHWFDRFGDGSDSKTMFKAGSLNKLTANHTNGEYILVLDADTTLHPNFLINMIQPLLHDPKIALTMPRYIVKKNNLIARWFRIQYNSNNILMKMRSYLNFPQFIGGDGIIVRKKIVKKFPWDTICEDALMSVNISLNGYSAWYVEKAIVYDHGIPTNVTDMKNRWARIVYGQTQAIKKLAKDIRMWKSIQTLILFSTVATLPFILFLFPVTAAMFYFGIDIYNHFVQVALISVGLIVWSVFFIIYASIRYNNHSDIFISPTITLMSIQYIVPGALAVVKGALGIHEDFYPTRRNREVGMIIKDKKLPLSIRGLETLYILASIMGIYYFSSDLNAVYFFTTYIIIMISSYIDIFN